MGKGWRSAKALAVSAVIQPIAAAASGSLNHGPRLVSSSIRRNGSLDQIAGDQHRSQYSPACTGNVSRQQTMLAGQQSRYRSGFPVRPRCADNSRGAQVHAPLCRVT
jgi:hypothetical protein